MIWLFSDYLVSAGGVETYLHALGTKLHADGIPFGLAVCEMAPCPFVDELADKAVRVYRQRKVPGDRWSIRQHALVWSVLRIVKPGDWIFCVRQPREQIFEKLVRGAHRRKVRVAASWMFTPDALEVDPAYMPSFCRAVEATDAVISVSRAGVPMYERFYGYTGEVRVVPLHNLEHFPSPLPMPSGPPWRFGYMGRLEESQKNLQALLEAFAKLARRHMDVFLDLHGGGPDQELLRATVSRLQADNVVRFHGAYDHRTDLKSILTNLHCMIYTSRYEGGPCFSLLEAMQAGRYVLATRVGGIPDLYERHPEAGHLIEGCEVNEILEGLEEVRRRLSAGRITVDGPRARYDSGFSMQHAHAAFLEALSLGKHEQPTPQLPCNSAKNSGF